MLTAARFWPQHWLAVGINEGWKRLCLAWLFSRMMKRRIEIGKYALICGMEIQKIQIVVHIFSGFALFTVLTWVYRKVESVSASFWPRPMCRMCLLIYQQMSAKQNTAGNDFSERVTQAEAHCERNLNRQLWSIRRNIASLFKEFFVGIIKS